MPEIPPGRVRLDGAQVAWMDSSPSCTHFLREISPFKQGFATKASFVVPQRTGHRRHFGVTNWRKGASGREDAEVIEVIGDCPSLFRGCRWQGTGCRRGVGIQEAWEERKWGQWVGTTEFCQVFLGKCA